MNDTLSLNMDLGLLDGFGRSERLPWLFITISCFFQRVSFSNDAEVEETWIIPR